jgi:uncharacterized integral membrane protein
MPGSRRASVTSTVPTPPVTGSHRLAVRERPLSRKRAGVAWAGLCVGVLTMVVLVVFMLQNTRSVQVSFLWMHGTVPLASALLIAAVGTAVVIAMVGTVRITQLRLRDRRS